MKLLSKNKIIRHYKFNINGGLDSFRLCTHVSLWNSDETRLWPFSYPDKRSFCKKCRGTYEANWQKRFYL